MKMLLVDLIETQCQKLLYINIQLAGQRMFIKMMLVLLAYFDMSIEHLSSTRYKYYMNKKMLEGK